MPTEGTNFHGRYGFKASSSPHPSSEIGNASNTFMFCVFRAFRGPLFRNLGLDFPSALSSCEKQALPPWSDDAACGVSV